MLEDGVGGLRDSVFIIPGDEVLVTCFCAKSLGLALEEHARVGFLVDEEDGGGHEEGSYEDDPEYPAPTGPLSNETACDGPDDGAKEWAEGVARGGQTTLVGGEEVGDDTTTEDETAGSAHAGKETAEDHGFEVVRQGTPDLEDAEDGVATIEDTTTTIDFGERGDEERAECPAEDENGDDKGGDDGVASVEVPHHEGDTGGEHSRGEGARVQSVLCFNSEGNGGSYLTKVIEERRDMMKIFRLVSQLRGSSGSSTPSHPTMFLLRSWSGSA